MKKIIAIIFSVSIAFGAGLYDDSYLVNSDKNQVESEENKNRMYGDFDKILRFEPIFFQPSTNTITQDSQEYLEEIVKAYKQYKDRKITLTIIGYTDRVQSKTEKTNQSKWFRTYDNDLTIESSQKIALDYATYVQEQLVDNNISKEIIIVESKGGLDNLYTRATTEGREKNYRAMVSIYISKSANADSDNDGIIDSKDKCSGTSQGHSVDKNGCSKLLNLTFNYKVNSFTLSDKSLKKLTTIITFMKEYPEFKVLLYGHTSNEGTKLKNQMLSEKRALSIRKYLISQDIQSSRISVYGKASTEPIASNNTVKGREKNRRVEIKLH